jgi:hypothetical protein
MNKQQLAIQEKWLRNYLKLIKKAKDDKEMCNIINQIYEDGLMDGSSN